MFLFRTEQNTWGRLEFAYDKRLRACNIYNKVILIYRNMCLYFYFLAISYVMFAKNSFLHSILLSL